MTSLASGHPAPVLDGNEADLSSTFIKQNKTRVFSLYIKHSVITYAIPESGTVRGRINLKDVQHIFFDTDKRFGNVEGENSNLKKRCAFLIELSSRTFKLTPQRETDMQVWLRALLRIEVLHDKITERQTSIRGSLTATYGVHLEKCLGIPHLYDRILNRKMSHDGSSSDADVPLEEGPNLFLHIDMYLDISKLV